MPILWIKTSMLKTINDISCAFKLEWSAHSRKHNFVLSYDKQKVSAIIPNGSAAHSYYAASILISDNLDLDPDKRYLIVVSDDKNETYLSFAWATDHVVAFTEKTTASIKDIDFLIESEFTNSQNLDSLLVMSDIKIALPKSQYKTFKRAKIQPREIALFHKTKKYFYLFLGFSTCVSIVICFFLWQFLKPPETVEAAQFKKVEIYTTDHTNFYQGCNKYLEFPWPISPEWVLLKQGCVANPSSLPKTGHGAPAKPYVFREYTLASKWDLYLSQAAGRLVAESRADSKVSIINKNLFSYSVLETTEIQQPTGYAPPTKFSEDVKDLFLGSLESFTPNENGPGGTTYNTKLSMRETIANIKQLKAEPSSITWNTTSQSTTFVLKPLALRIERYIVSDPNQ